MSGIVIGNTLRTSWKQILYWGLGLGVLGLYIDFIAMSPDIISGYADLFKAMPPALLQAFGASDLALFTTSEGWIVSIFVSEAAIFLSIFAVMAGLNITANDEQSGVMDVILSLPISRSAYMLERWIGYALIGLGIVVLCALITVAGIIGMNIDAPQDVIFKSIMNLYPGTLLAMTVTCLLTTVLRRRAVAIGASAAFVVVSYVFNVIGASAGGAIADLMESLSYFSYIQGEAFVIGAYDPVDSVIVLIAVLVGFALSLKMFVSRDIGV
ncbi:MAG: ABC transporter permease subunit [Chloroflexi bacterium]|nr:ABC transporter permease subunit [Chloroflexota bacterium]